MIVGKQYYFEKESMNEINNIIICSIFVQILREKDFKQIINKVKIEEDEEITWEKATQTIKRASHYLSALQTSDGHWPAHLGGCQFFIPILVTSTYSKYIIYTF